MASWKRLFSRGQKKPESASSPDNSRPGQVYGWMRPMHPVEHLMLGEQDLQEGRLQDAAREFSAAIELMPENAEAHNGLGAAYGRMGRSAEAMHEYREALRYNPRLAPTHYNLGVQYEIQGKLDEAIAEFEAALRFEPDLIEAHCDLGILYGRKGRVQDEIEQYQQALELDPNDKKVRHNLGITYRNLGQLVEAERELTVAAQLGFAPALQALRQLQADRGGSQTGPIASAGQAVRGSHPATTASVSDDRGDEEDEDAELEEDDETHAPFDFDPYRVLGLTIPNQEFAQQCMELLTVGEDLVDEDREQASDRVHLQRCIEKLRPFTTAARPASEILLTVHEAWAWGNAYEGALDAEVDGLLEDRISWWHDQTVSNFMMALAIDLRGLVATAEREIGVTLARAVEPDHAVHLLAPWDILGMAKLEVFSRRVDLLPQQPKHKPDKLTAAYNSWLGPHHNLDWAIVGGLPGWSPVLCLNVGEHNEYLNPSSEYLHAMAVEPAQNDVRYEALMMHIADQLTAEVDSVSGGRVDMRDFELRIRPLLGDHPWLGVAPHLGWNTGPSPLWLMH